jgi:hypothetical protein
MLRFTKETAAAFEHAAYRDFAQRLCNWWSMRLPWFVGVLLENSEATGLHVIEEASSYGYVKEAEIMRYSVGYVFFGSRFPQNPLYENLLTRCHWKDAVAPILKLARVLDHVDMLTWDGTFSEQRGCLENIPCVADGPRAPLSTSNLADALQMVPTRRLAHMSLDQLESYVRVLHSRLDASGISADWHLRVALLGVFVGWNWTNSPAYAWILDAIQRNDTDTITRRLHEPVST